MTNGTMETDAIKTYRYLRLGMVGLVVLLTASVLLERRDAPCWLTSISAYYYTPVRAIFVGALFAIGFALIVLKGNSSWEDTFLNFAGMFAPVVAVVPTEFDADKYPMCGGEATMSSIEANIDNNFAALLWAGFFGLVLAVAIVLFVNRSLRALVSFRRDDPRVGLIGAAVLLLVGVYLFNNWDSFDTRMHGLAAVLMFACLAVAVGMNAWAHRDDRDVYFWLYLGIAVLMVVTAIVVFAIGTAWDHGVLILEVVEIFLFAVFWIAQTVEFWDETVRGSSSSNPTAPAPATSPTP